MNFIYYRRANTCTFAVGFALYKACLSFQTFADRVEASFHQRRVSACRMFCFSDACALAVGGTLSVHIMSFIFINKDI